MELQTHLAQATYQLLFGHSGSRLLGEVISEILGLEEDYVSKRHSRQLSQMALKQLSSKGRAPPKQPQSQGQCGKGPVRGRGSSEKGSH